MSKHRFQHKKFNANGSPKQKKPNPMNSKFLQKDGTRAEFVVAESSGNDPQWYNRTPQVLKDAASLSFADALGDTVTQYNDLVTSSDVVFQAGNYGNRVPGIMSLEFVPGPGKADSAQSAINIAAKNMYSYIRHANSGHANYDSPDLMMYFMALDSAYMMYSYGVRAYRTLMPTTVKNRYLPHALLNAQGWRYTDLVTRIADFRAYLNAVAVKLSAFAAPKDLTIFARHSWLVSGVWSDSKDIEKSQTYLYNPAGFYTYVEGTAGTPGHCSYVSMATYLARTNVDSNGLTFAGYVGLMESILQPLIASEDVGIMSGDILKAYGDEKLYKVHMITENETLLPQFDELVLRQIQNTTTVGPIDTGTANITQDATIGSPTEGCILYGPKFNLGTYSAAAWQANCVAGLNKKVNAGEEAPDELTVAELTRNICLMQPKKSGTSASDTTWCEMAACGSEVFTCMVIWYYNTANNTATGLDVTKTRTSINSPSAQQYATFAMSTMFDFHPELFILITGGLLDIWDCENYCNITPTVLKKVHDACILSEFGVPAFTVA